MSWSPQDEKVPDASFFSVLRLNIPEWPYIFVGTFCAMINGAMQPAFAIIFSKIITVGSSHSSKGDAFRRSNNFIFLFFFLSSQVFADPDQDSVRKKSEFFALMFAAIGCVSFVTMFLQVSFYPWNMY